MMMIQTDFPPLFQVFVLQTIHIFLYFPHKEDDDNGSIFLTITTPINSANVLEAGVRAKLYTQTIYGSVTYYFQTFPKKKKKVC